MADTKPRSPKAPASLSRSQYQALAEWRYQLRSFLAFSEAAAAAAGVPPQQHQALLAIAGRPGEGPMSVGELAHRLLIAAHTAAELVTRMAQAGLVVRRPSAVDGRRVDVELTPRAEAVLAELTQTHWRELRKLEQALMEALVPEAETPPE